MNCRDIKRKILFAPDSLESAEVRRHVERCQNCRRSVAGERLTSMMIRSGMRGDDLQAVSPFLMSRIRARIGELHDQGAGSWESAILALRGWLIAFGAVAAVLLLMTGLWGSRNSLTRDHDTELSSISNVNEVLLSGNIPGEAKKEAIGDGFDE